MTSDENDFAWSADNEDIIQHSVQGVAAYLNVYGNITIRQEKGIGDEHDSQIMLTLESARALSEKLKELILAKQL